MRFADLERKLGEIDRARSIYAHCSQICDPRVITTLLHFAGGISRDVQRTECDVTMLNFATFYVAAVRR